MWRAVFCGHVTQWKSAILTRWKSQVRTLSCPQKICATSGVEVTGSNPVMPTVC